MRSIVLYLILISAPFISTSGARVQYEKPKDPCNSIRSWVRLRRLMQPTPEFQAILQALRRPSMILETLFKGKSDA